MANNDINLDKLFCLVAKKYKLNKLDLKAMAVVESNLDTNAYRFEQGFWDRYLKDNSDWNNRDPKEVSASYGLMQIMYVVAWELGFRGRPEDLYNPVYNVELAAKLLRRHLDWMAKPENNPDCYVRFWPWELALAWYNGGRGAGPKEDCTLKNQEYVDKVKWAKWKLIKSGEEDCE